MSNNPRNASNLPPAAGPSGTNQAGRSATLPKAIGSLAKKQDDVTRQGTQKMKFVPTLPVRKKKTEEKVKKEDASSAAVLTPSQTPGRGRGRGRGEGRGGGPRPPAEMIASGPFALGPAMAGTSARRAAPRSNFTPIIPLGAAASSALGSGLTMTTAPSLKEEAAGARMDRDAETYSDPDEGVEIVDITDVRRMDWMAPESLKKEAPKKKKVNIMKQEGKPVKRKSKGNVNTTFSWDEDTASEEEQVDLANALDLSESEEEDEMDDLMDDFALQDQEIEEGLDVRAEKLYFLQFPIPFPSFVPAQPTTSEEDKNVKGKGKATDPEKGKKVTFAEDVTEPASTSDASAPVASMSAAPDEAEKTEDPVDGIIGRLEIYQSGAVKMRLSNGIVFDVAAATQPSFLQLAVHLDMENKKLSVLGEVNRRFVVSPNIDTLLETLDVADQDRSIEAMLGSDLTKMDTS